MKGRATLLCIGLTVAVGVGLFHVKYKVQALEDELTRLNRGIVHEQEQIHVLRAEWSYLNRPQRLEELNTRHLGLAPLAPEQIGSVESLPLRAPGPVAEGAGESGGHTTRKASVSVSAPAKGAGVRGKEER